MKNFIFASCYSKTAQLFLFILMNLFVLNLKAENKKMTYSCDLKDKENFASQISLEVYADHLVALETTKETKKSFYVLKTERTFSEIKKEEQNDKVHTWYSFTILKGDYKAYDEFPETKNNQEVVLIYMSHLKKDNTKADIYINRLFYNDTKTENLDFKGNCKKK